MKASDANELLCDNNNIYKDSLCQSVRFFLRKLDFLDKIFWKKTIFLFPTKFMRILSKVNIINDQKNLGCERVIVWQQHRKDSSCQLDSKDLLLFYIFNF